MRSVSVMSEVAGSVSLKAEVVGSVYRDNLSSKISLGDS